ncbi:MAG: carboxypeptidase regulatory-like domain-containing protein [Candidatus Jettenia sp.]|uniref:Carboxypeptidase regulatory-like domain-containing protein n=1 Tax=Candidatus Jettenia caeni TaxID=247490 RepID=I3IHD2_9BACT|nr:carboxypeptidase-like regulatory domain-containing protein [Candidatus Jettenia sp. AMX1]MBC6930122.1 carboxypeptidase regulatory-like domain-containing protein [Candidatus Jettenia sp.]NUN22577.1 carboxypeptidase regulatory-like domain-containing protein [Candidatus Jettenia caeni]KAA0248126.1 MAG: carboxypeptidase regulatory-like domain-containing protein [Candidatus Jettenia sp. AMX1]MCE7881747.1 carboxypeptidase regulatory-like domain-containing protein [Candidatus Jettenia sp. AMX1]MCQ
MKKCKIVVFLIMMGFYATANGDTLTLKNISKGIDLKVIGVADECIKAIILKNDVKSLSMQFSDTKNYSDVIFLDISNVAIECKVKEVTNDSIQVLIPTTLISALQMSFQSQDKQIDTALAEIEHKPKIVMDQIAEEKKSEQITEGKKAEFPISDSLEEKAIADEIRMDQDKVGAEKHYRLKTKKTKKENPAEEDNLSEIETKSVLLDSEISDSNRDEKLSQEGGKTSGLEEELSEGLTDNEMDKGLEKPEEEHLLKGDSIPSTVRFGSVEGKILHGAKPLPDCQVKLQILEKIGLLTKGYRPVEGSVEFETVTDKDGVYHFMNIPPGLYKVYWKPLSDTDWVRRFKMEPDVIVEPGKLTNPKTIETLRRTLN